MLPGVYYRYLNYQSSSGPAAAHFRQVVTKYQVEIYGSEQLQRPIPFFAPGT